MMWGRVAGFAVIGLGAWIGGAPVPAQNIANLAPAPEAVESDILVLNFPQIYARSEIGIAIQTRDAEARQEIEAENQRIVAELTAEERALSEARATMPVDEFRAAAQAFDAKSEAARQRPYQLNLDRQAAAAARRETFERQIIAPVVNVVMQNADAVVVMAQSDVWLNARRVDITDEVVFRLDALYRERGDAIDALLFEETGAASPLPDDGLISEENRNE